MILKPCLRRLLFTNGRDFPAVLALATDEPPRSAAGSRYLERILTVSETCRQQGRNAYQFLIEAMEASFASQSAPSLVPTKATSENQAAAA